MTRRLVSIALALPFAAITALALRESGFFGIPKLHFQTWGGLQVLVDLVIMASLACVWMFVEGRGRGRRTWPYVALTLVAGSFGPIAHLAFSESSTGVRGEAPAPPPLMNRLPRWGWISVLVVTLLFGVLSAKALAAQGYFGIWHLQLACWASLQVLADLTILCLLACVWMVQDARCNGTRAWPFLLLTLAAGSFGPLAYLLLRDRPAVPTSPSRKIGIDTRPG